MKNVSSIHRGLLIGLVVLAPLPLDRVTAATAVLPRISHFERLQSGEFQLQLETEAGASYAFQASVNLTNWFNLRTTIASSSKLDFSDPHATNLGALFYRARVAGDADAPNPLTVVAMLDTNRAVAKSISRSGGTLTLTILDGTVFNLTIPTNALLSPETISMTVVTNVNGLPLSGGLAGAVQPGPEGLLLLEPATLTITGPVAQPATNFQQIGFAYHGSGQEFHLYPASLKAGQVIFRLLHFSGYGVGHGTSQDAGNQRGRHPPTSQTDQSEQNTDLSAALETLYQTFLPLALNAQALSSVAAADEDFLEPAYEQFKVFLSLVEGNALLAARFAGQISVIEQNLAAGVVLAVNKAYLKCLTDRDPGQIATILRLALWAQVRPEINRLVPVEGLRDKARQCARFELTFDSTIVMAGNGASFNSHVKATCPVQFDLDLMQLQGSGPLAYLQFTATADCPITATTSGSTFMVMGGSLNLNLQAGLPLGTPPAPPPQLTLLINPGTPSEVITAHCPNAPPVAGPVEIWVGGFFSHHQDEIEISGADLKIENWTMAGTDIFATKTYNRSGVFDEATITENTTLELRHTPGP